MDTNPYAAAWSDVIVRGRDAKGYSRDQLAGLLGVTYQAVQHWELGRSAPAPRHQASMILLFRLDDAEVKRLALTAGIDPKAAA